MKRFFIVYLKGALIGGTLTVPGVSGGSMSMILGIYESLMAAISSFKFLRILPFAAGWGYPNSKGCRISFESL